MAKRGPPKTPSNIAHLRSNPSNRPAPVLEPAPGLQRLRAPKGMSASAQRRWRRLSTTLYQARVLTAMDESALKLLVDSLEQYELANAEVQKSGLIILTTNGNYVQNPYLAIANRASDRIMRLLGQFGMTPSSRTGVEMVAEDGEAVDDADGEGQDDLFA